MPWVALVETDTQLARILGVSRQAVAKAAARGMLVRAPDGRWDALAALDRWRRYVNPLLQRRSPVFRPWLDPQVPLVPSVWDEFVRRVKAGGADVRWEHAGPRARGERADRLE
jgi:hypothetical protein